MRNVRDVNGQMNVCCVQHPSSAGDLVACHLNDSETYKIDSDGCELIDQAFACTTGVSLMREYKYIAASITICFRHSLVKPVFVLFHFSIHIFFRWWVRASLYLFVYACEKRARAFARQISWRSLSMWLLLFYNWIDRSNGIHIICKICLW